MGEGAAPVAHYHVGAPCHTCMDSILPEHQAECRVVRIGGNTPYSVAGIYKLEIDLFADPLKVSNDLIAQEDPDVSKTDITGRILLMRPLHEILAGSLAHYDDSMSSSVQSRL